MPATKCFYNAENNYFSQIEQCCSCLESRLQGVGEVQSRVRDVFSQLADLDDELDSLSPVGRDADSLASQAEAVKGFLSRLAALRTEVEGHGGECTTMLRREGSSPDLLALRRETEALSRQAAKLAERGQGRLALIEAAEERVKEFYARLTELQGLLDRAEEGVNAQGIVGTEVEVIKQQLQEFKVRNETFHQAKAPVFESNDRFCNCGLEHYFIFRIPVSCWSLLLMTHAKARAGDWTLFVSFACFSRSYLRFSPPGSPV